MVGEAHTALQPLWEEGLQCKLDRHEKIARLMGCGEVTPLIDSVFKANELSAAIARVQSRHARGEAVIHIQ